MKRSVPIVLCAIAAAALFATRSVAEEKAAKAAMVLESDSFQDGQLIPSVNTCDGDDRSPALHWQGAPAETRALALLLEDPDAPSGTWSHWVLFNVPSATQALAAAVPIEATLGDGSKQGTNDFGRIGYGGPCPPKGSEHRYEFRIYALSAPLELKPGAKRDAVLEALEEITIAKAKLVGRYKRHE